MVDCTLAAAAEDNKFAAAVDCSSVAVLDMVVDILADPAVDILVVDTLVVDLKHQTRINWITQHEARFSFSQNYSSFATLPF